MVRTGYKPYRNVQCHACGVTGHIRRHCRASLTVPNSDESVDNRTVVVQESPLVAKIKILSKIRQELL